MIALLGCAPTAPVDAEAPEDTEAPEDDCSEPEDTEAPEDTGAPEDTDDPVDDGAEPPAFAGTFALAFTGPIEGDGVAPPPFTPFSPSQGIRLDLEIRAADGGGLEATIAPDGGEAQLFGVLASDEAVTLTGSLGIEAEVDGWTVEDSWSTFVLGRAPGGELDGSFRATGRQLASRSEDVIGEVWWSNLSTGGTVD